MNQTPPLPETTAWLRRKVRRLTFACLGLWMLITLLPLGLSLLPGWYLGDWPLDFWMAAQGSVLGYLALTVVYAWLVNRWERQAGTTSVEPPAAQED